MKVLYFIIVFLMFIVIVRSQPDDFFQVELEEKNGELRLMNLRVSPLTDDVNNFGVGYFLEIISLNETILNKDVFGFPNFSLYDTFDPETDRINGGGSFIRNESTTTLYLPYYPNAKEINIYDLNFTLKLKIPVQQFAKEKSAETNQQQEKQLDKKASIKDQKEPSKFPFVIVGGIILLIIIVISLIGKRMGREK